MFEHGLSGRLWPIRFKPYSDELLSSWLIRLIHAYGMEPDRFCARVWRRYGFWQRDLDKGMDDELLLVLAEKTATPRDRILATTFRGYAGYHETQLSDAAREPTPWLRYFGLWSPRIDSPWLQYCPYCLREDAVPYFRRHWRLAFVAVCILHRRRLLDRCTNCMALVRFHQLAPDVESITQCYNCLSDLRSASSVPLGFRIEDGDLLDFQSLLLDTMKTGWYQLPGYQPIRAIPFFLQLQACGRFMIATKRELEPSKGSWAYFRRFPFDLRVPSGAQQAMEVLPAYDRIRLLLLMYWWINHWPQKFLKRFTASIFIPSRFRDT